MNVQSIDLVQHYPFVLLVSYPISSLRSSNLFSPAEITSTKSRSGSIASANFPPPTTTNHRSKVGPPVSYPKHYYPPPSTTSVVKQLIHNSGSLVYDSSTQKSSMKIPTLIKTPINLEQTREELRNTNADLTGRQLLPEHRKNKVNFPKKIILKSVFSF